VNSTERSQLSVIVGRRPNRQVPAPHKVAAWWAEHPGVFDVDPQRPECFRCKAPGRAWRCGYQSVSLERAHLVDRIRGGLDHAGNLAVLCHHCHVQMPSFGNGEWFDAVTWINTTFSVTELYTRRAALVHRQHDWEAVLILCPLLRPTDWYNKAIAATDVAIARLTAAKLTT
jgi:5-methylcytosine-specific restriction endonuclease McrA